MREFIIDQRNMFFISIMLGASMGAFYDVFRCVRRIIPHNNFFIAAEDVLYWLFWTYVIIDGIHKYNNGSLRGYVFFGLAVGTVFYHATISWVIMRCLTHILWFVKKTSKKINKLLKNRVKKGKITLSLSRRISKK